MESALDMNADMTPILKTSKLCRKFGDLYAVRDLDLEVRKGELFGIVGPDGAGKTTTIRMLAGIMEPSSGDVWVKGISVKDDPEAIKEHIAYMPQRFGLYQDLTVIENLLFYAELFRVPKRLRGPRIDQLFGFSRLGPFKDRLAGALSGGMKQKLGLACALIHSPDILLLDEPTNGVDPVSRRDFWKILYDLLKEGITILVSTAYLDEAERTTRTGLLHEGRMVQCGEPSALKERVSGAIYRLVSAQPDRARTILSGLEGVLGAHVFGEGLHVRVEHPGLADTIEGELLKNGVEAISLKPISPSMEDAFLALIPAAPSAEEKTEQ
ncbi:MAG: ABC transporter ATP-binding protein [Thermodesulfobacteriota bacterium]